MIPEGAKSIEELTLDRVYPVYKIEKLCYCGRWYFILFYGNLPLDGEGKSYLSTTTSVKTKLSKLIMEAITLILHMSLGPSGNVVVFNSRGRVGCIYRISIL
jgi:hypothetical protein